MSISRMSVTGSVSALRTPSNRTDDSASPQPRRLEVVSKQATKVTAISTRLEWKIDQFEKLMKLFKNGHNLISKQFGCPQAPTVTWELHVYPNGKREEDAGNVSFFLRQVGLQRGEEPIMTEFQIYALDANTLRVSVCRDTKDFTNQQGRGKFQVSREKMMAALKPDGALLLICEVEYFPPGSKISVEQAVEPEQSDDYEEKSELSIRDALKEMLDSELFADCCIKVGNKTLRAHRCILGQHSEVFRSMFAQESMLEAQKGVIDIQDCRFEPVRAMIDYIYTGSTELVEGYAEDVLAIADKYAILPLKEQCERYLATTINSKNVASTAVFADTFSASILRQVCANVERNTHLLFNLMSTDTWRIVCITYNINARQTESDQIYQLLDQEDVGNSDVCAIALQVRWLDEVTSVDGIVCIYYPKDRPIYSGVREGILPVGAGKFSVCRGASMGRGLRSAELELSHSELFGTVPSEVTWQSNFTAWMIANGRCLVGKQSSASNLLLVFARLHLFRWIDKIDSKCSRSSFGNDQDESWLVFASSHLLPHTDGYEARCLQYGYGKAAIFENITDNGHAIMWLGDMNWRVDALSAQQMFDRLNAVKTDEEMERLVDEVDQLRRAQRDNKAFTDFREAPIHFAPTYRILVGRTRFDAERVPSWCDRILYRGERLECLRYSDNRLITISDHFPVCAQFNFHLVTPQRGTTQTTPQWNIEFEPIPRWFSVVPFTCRFSFRNKFWQRFGSYRDWVGVFPSQLPDPSRPLHWLYAVMCYESVIGARTLNVAEFSCLAPGAYRLGYWSVTQNCLQGISNPFEIEHLSSS
ncbi:unnamed protein product [Anisakis simplex]|uniref:BTB domain-containing protein n=1 Tax=Anisakis simplex TaxID=6269 RepID=A0A0M3K6U6_ANISI|nr:unnamed protein product [Anisakis simplex]